MAILPIIQVLHPSFHMQWLEMNYSQSVADCVEKLLEEIFTQYKESSGAAPSQPAATNPNTPKSFFDCMITTMFDANKLVDAFKELETYLNGTYPYVDRSVLLWWKTLTMLRLNILDPLSQAYEIAVGPHKRARDNRVLRFREHLKRACNSNSNIFGFSACTGARTCSLQNFRTFGLAQPPKSEKGHK
ncbi:hypothetical protein BDN71DRAFT_1533565 [Pleurotus eryngii]|uniref:Uncharacterized protein n=1 Tax=Pleurotus eryngii TaxID=5323 RepID=A0A9P6DAP9_PLEER|nr:hypothetical protein BDN71DRAFT_1533565 [Pleurotus eryngii]